MKRPSGHKLGRRAEWAALLLLMSKGYRPRHRNWRGAGGELDLVMRHRGETVFVEVKARSSDLFGGAAAALNAKKQKVLFAYCIGLPRPVRAMGASLPTSISSLSNERVASFPGASATTAMSSSRTWADNFEFSILNVEFPPTFPRN